MPVFPGACSRQESGTCMSVPALREGLPQAASSPGHRLAWPPSLGGTVNRNPHPLPRHCSGRDTHPSPTIAPGLLAASRPQTSLTAQTWAGGGPWWTLSRAVKSSFWVHGGGGWWLYSPVHMQPLKPLPGTLAQPHSYPVRPRGSWMGLSWGQVAGQGHHRHRAHPGPSPPTPGSIARACSQCQSRPGRPGIKWHSPWCLSPYLGALKCWPHPQPGGTGMAALSSPQLPPTTLVRWWHIIRHTHRLPPPLQALWPRGE